MVVGPGAVATLLGFGAGAHWALGIICSGHIRPSRRGRRGVWRRKGRARAVGEYSDATAAGTVGAGGEWGLGRWLSASAGRFHLTAARVRAKRRTQRAHGGAGARRIGRGSSALGRGKERAGPEADAIKRGED